MANLPVAQDEPLRAELIAFLHAVRSGAEPAVTGDEGVASLEIATRCLETPANPAAASPARKGPRRVVGYPRADVPSPIPAKTHEPSSANGTPPLHLPR